MPPWEGGGGGDIRSEGEVGEPPFRGAHGSGFSRGVGRGFLSIDVVNKMNL